MGGTYRNRFTTYTHTHTHTHTHSGSHRAFSNEKTSRGESRWRENTWLCVCVCVLTCVQVCVCVYMSECVYVCACECVYVSMRVCMCASEFLNVCDWVWVCMCECDREGNGSQVQYSCLENPMDRGDCRLQSTGSQRVRYDWATSLSLFTFIHWRSKWQHTPVFVPGESQGRQSLVGCLLWSLTESDATEAT